MKKSAWVSFCGWAVVALGATELGIMAVDYRYRPGPYPLPPMLWGFLFLLCFPLAILWFLGTVIHRIRWSGAKMSAQAWVEAQAQAGIRPPSTPVTSLAAPSAIGGDKLCGMCRRRDAVVQCVAHRVLLCGDCWSQHHNQQHPGEPRQVQAAGGR